MLFKPHTTKSTTPSMSLFQQIFLWLGFRKTLVFLNSINVILYYPKFITCEIGFLSIS